MALFSRSKKTEEQAPATAAAPKAPKREAVATDRDLAGIILNPRITEKAVKLNDHNVYTFNVHKDASKYEVRDAVAKLFNVTPVKVNIVNKKPRQHASRTRGRVVSEKGIKKAYVYLKKGETINLI